MSNSTNRQRAARKLAADLGIPYQQALNAIIEATSGRGPTTPRPTVTPPVEPPAPRPDSDYTWRQFPIGWTETEEEVVLDLLLDPHVLIGGLPGSGKTVLQHNIINRALRADWDIIAIDPKGSELDDYQNHPSVIRYARELDEITDALEAVEQNMVDRYAAMEAAGAAHIWQLPTPPRPLMVVIDRVFTILAADEAPSEDSKWRDEQRLRCGIRLGSLARLSRVTGVHLVISTGSPEARILEPELLSNLPARIAVGRMNTGSSLNILDSPDAADTPTGRGQAIIRYTNPDTRIPALQPFTMYGPGRPAP